MRHGAGPTQIDTVAGAELWTPRGPARGGRVIGCGRGRTETVGLSRSCAQPTPRPGGLTPRPSGARAGARRSASRSHCLLWPATDGLSGSPDVTGPAGMSSRPPSERRQRSEGIEVAAPAAPVAKSLESSRSVHQNTLNAQRKEFWITGKLYNGFDVA